MAAELGYRQEDWLLALPADAWLLQLALATTEDAARSMLDQLGRERGGYYRGQRDGRTVFLVMAGPWPSRDAAVAARADLPASLRDRGPFPRSVEAVVQDIR
jgi:DamX protein